MKDIRPSSHNLQLQPPACALVIFVGAARRKEAWA